MAVSEEDFKLLLTAVRTIHDNMELNYNAFRHSAELRTCAKTLDRLVIKYDVLLDSAADD